MNRLQCIYFLSNILTVVTKTLHYKKLKPQNQIYTMFFQQFQLSVAVHAVLFELPKICTQSKISTQIFRSYRIQKFTNNCFFKQMIIN